MKVFVPTKGSANKYIDEIEKYFNGKFIYGDLKEYREEYEIVNIHWPEAILGWKEPTDKELNIFEKHLKIWKSHSKIVFTRHNENPHYRNTKQFKKLYELVFNYSDGIIHLGKYSHDELEIELLDKKHCVIYHPLFASDENVVSKIVARKYFNISLNSEVILVFGRIRHKDEIKLIFKAFKKLKIKNKILLISRFPIDLFKTKYNVLNKLINKFIITFFRFSKQYKVFYEIVPDKNIQYFLNAADVVFVARTKILNSGNVYLGYSFDKVVVGPNTGNITESLNNHNYPIYNPQDINSVSKALLKGLELSKSNLAQFNMPIIKKTYKPKTIAQKYFSFFDEVLNE